MGGWGGRRCWGLRLCGRSAGGRKIEGVASAGGLPVLVCASVVMLRLAVTGGLSFMPVQPYGLARDGEEQAE